MSEKQIYLNLITIYLSRVSTIVMLVPIIIALTKRNYSNTPLKFIYIFSIIRISISILIQIIVWATLNYKTLIVPIFNRLEIKNMNFMAIFAHLNYFGLLGLYFSLVITDRKLSLFIKWVSILLFISATVNYLFIEGYKNHSVFNSTASNIYCFALPLIHLWFLFNQDVKVTLTKNPYFWISMGLLVPNLLGLITSLFGSKLASTDLTLYLQVEIVYGILQILGYLLIAVGFYYAHNTKYLPLHKT